MTRIHQFNSEPLSATLSLDSALKSSASVEVQQRIFRQLLESLIYEQILEAQEESTDEGLDCFRLAGKDGHNRPVEYFALGQRQQGFNRIRLRQAVQRRDATSLQEAPSLAQFLLEVDLPCGVSPQRLSAFIDEIQHTLMNDVVAQYYRQHQSRIIRHEAYDAIEFAAIDGHPYHPCYKSRMGFSQSDAVAYSPDFQPQLALLWIALRSDTIRLSAVPSISPEAFLQQQLGTRTYGQFIDKIQRSVAQPENYQLLPVHPWQWQQIAPHFVSEIADGRIIILGQGRDRYCPQQSIRTLANISQPEKACVKLPLSIVNTSTSRILSPHTIENAARISGWLTLLWQQDAYLHRDLKQVLLKEVLGIAYNHEILPDLLKPKAYGTLGVIWRESLIPHLQADEQAIPGHALCYLDGDHRPLIDDWIQNWGVKKWVTQFLNVSILPLIHWLYAHGIALEAHAQNMVLLHRNGYPTRLALKDFHDGIRFARAHLQQPDLCPSLIDTPAQHARVNRNSYIETNRPTGVRDFLLDAFFFINLSEIAWFLDQNYALNESWFWSTAAQIVLGYQARFPHLSQRFQIFDLFADTFQVEQLTKRRLFPDTEFRLQSVPNPLASARQGI